MATKKSDNVFVRAKAYRKAHPRCSFQDAIKKVSGKKRKPAAKKAAPKKKSAVGRVHHKKSAKKKAAPRKAAAPKARKIKVKIKPRSKGGSSISIGGIAGISLGKVKTELSHQAALTKIADRHKAHLKTKGLKSTEKAVIRRDIKKAADLIRASKRNVSAYKKYI